MPGKVGGPFCKKKLKTADLEPLSIRKGEVLQQNHPVRI